MAVEKPSSGWELLGKYLGIFTDRVEVGFDQKIMALLEAERRRAAGLAEDEEEEEPPDGSCAEPKNQLAQMDRAAVS